MKINLKYYVIHNLEKDRYENTLNLLKKYGVDLDDVTFVNHPNKNELTYQIKKKAVQKKSNIKDGWISCSYKHYLALEQIIKNKDELAIIMEDNIGEFFEPIIDRISKYLNELPEDWDVVYDSVWGDYNALGEEKIDKKKYKWGRTLRKSLQKAGNTTPRHPNEFSLINRLINAFLLRLQEVHIRPRNTFVPLNKNLIPVPTKPK